jgi:hypothetical protein
MANEQSKDSEPDKIVSKSNQETTNAQKTKSQPPPELDIPSAKYRVQVKNNSYIKDVLSGRKGGSKPNQ